MWFDEVFTFGRCRQAFQVFFEKLSFCCTLVSRALAWSVIGKADRQRGRTGTERKGKL